MCAVLMKLSEKYSAVFLCMITLLFTLCVNSPVHIFFHFLLTGKMSIKNKPKCSYNVLIHQKEFPWSQADEKDPYSFICKLCNPKKSMSLSNMGKRALSSHEKSEKHKSIMNASKSTTKLIINVTNLNSTNITNSTDSNNQTVQANTSSNQNLDKCTVPESEINHNLDTSTQNKKVTKVRSITTLLSNDDELVEAHTIWILEGVSRHLTLRDIESGTKVMPRMFKDSQIAKNIPLSKDKISYIINYGLSYHFKIELLDIVEKCDEIVIGFDETHNCINKKEQMDFTLRFWHSDNNEVTTRYLSSAFLGHTTAKDLLEAFEENVPEKLLKKTHQLSMDGPNVNWKLLKDFQAKLSDMGISKTLIDIGSCPLHVVHNAFKSSFESCDWKIDQVLKALFNLYDGAPARREDYLKVSVVKVFPKYFTGIRWIENHDVAERAREVILSVQKHIDKMKINKKEPSSNSYKIVKNAIFDELLDVKLAFFQEFASFLKPFLTEYQSDEPKVPFLYNDMKKLYEKILKKIINPACLKGHESDPVQIDLNEKKNLLTATDIKLDYETKCALKKIENTKNSLEICKFKATCITIYKTFLIKLLEKSPLKYPLVKGISCFDPEIAIETNEAEARIAIVLEIFVENRMLASSVANEVESQFLEVISMPATKEKLKTFRRYSEIKKNQSSSQNSRLDHLWVTILETFSTNKYSKLYNFIKSVMIISHGNAALERGFSINKECLTQNQHEKSMISRRIICDKLNQLKCPLENFVISKNLIKDVRLSSSRYKQDLAKQKEDEEKKNKSNREKKRKAEELNELYEKKRKIEENAEKEKAEIDQQIFKLKVFN